ncbi:hypothetical protein [Halomarina litorea]|uniref:hypothetical protein n=1 Tax=Halomarina litorea TaxID=2961595 RepID=UPI0020C4B499|nr:hypothetical protein [Halomarina sp. BCD28]
MYDKLLFRRGFVLFEDGCGVDVPSRIEDWGRERFGRYVLRTHPDLRYSAVETGGTSVGISGRVFDPVGGVADTDTILATLARRLGESDDRFFDYLDRLSGRFVLLAEAGERAFALQDATGNHALFYDDDDPERCVLATHPGLVAEMGGYRPTGGAAAIRSADAPWFPGAATPYAEVKLLTPNTLLTLPENAVRRFFPRERLPENPLTDDLVADVADVFRTSVELLDRDNDLSLSLSAGLDSRLSLAATRDVSDDVYYTTWVTGDGDEEVATVEELSENVGVEYTPTDLSETPDDSFADCFTTNTAGMSRPNRCRNAYNLFHRRRPAEGTVGIRSNVAEIARTFYRDRFRFLPDEVDAEVLAKLYGFESQTAYVQAMYEDFIDRAEFPRGDVHGYDVYDLFYWECRIGCWLSLWFLETSIAQEEISLFNNRYLLKKMLSVEYEHRRSNELFYRVIGELWPECLDIPVNPHEEPSIEGMERVDRFLSGMMFRAPTPVYTMVRNVRRMT